MRFLLVAGLLALYLVARAVFPACKGWKKRVLFSGLLLFVLLHYPLLANFFGNMASLELPRPLLLPLAAGFMSLLILAVLLLLRDLLGLLLWPLARRAGTYLLGSGRLLAALALLALGLGSFGVWQAVKVPEVKRMEIALARLPAAFEGYRIVHLTDLHVSRLLDGDWAKSVVARSNALGADAILISGDLIDGSVSLRAPDYPALAHLHARDGVFASPGNHEYYSGYRQWMQTFERLGFVMLPNRHALIRRGDAVLVVAGVTDQVAGGRGEVAPDLAAALAGAPEGVRILLDHRPAHAAENRKLGIDLQLSGHTHGGHALGLHRLVAAFNNGFVSGLYSLGDMQLYVGNGAGLWPGFALRLGKPSEITEITLRRQLQPSPHEASR